MAYGFDPSLVQYDLKEPLDNPKRIPHCKILLGFSSVSWWEFFLP